MALTADVELAVTVIDRIYSIKAGAADTLYKGALVNVGTDGYIKVAADVANEYPIGVMKKQVVAAGSNVEDCEIISGVVRIAHSGAAQTDVGALFHASADDTLGDGAGTNVSAIGVCVGWETGYLWIDMMRRSI